MSSELATTFGYAKDGECDEGGSVLALCVGRSGLLVQVDLLELGMACKLKNSKIIMNYGDVQQCGVIFLPGTGYG